MRRRDRDLDRTTWLIAVAIAVWTIVGLTGSCDPEPAHADPGDQNVIEEPEPTRNVEAELELAVAKVCANESSLLRAISADCALIWQTTRRHGHTAVQRLDWLTRHSSCVLTDRALRPTDYNGNCPWSRNLTDSDVEPEGWPHEADSLPWAGRPQRQWHEMRRFTGEMVRFNRPPRAGWPCPVDPSTWGGPMDHNRALRLGMVALHCVIPRSGRVNEGYLYRRRAAEALGASSAGAADAGE